jgi:beta-mannosidase
MGLIQWRNGECVVRCLWHRLLTPRLIRNYAADNRIRAYFGDADLNSVGEDYFSLQMYQSMMAQVFYIKGRVEMMRVQNSFGALIWQLNENWPTGGWGTLEYGPRAGMTNQVAGGRWKPLHYVLRRTTFQDVTVVCGADSLCYAINDGLIPQSLTFWVEAWKLSTETALTNTEMTIDLPIGRSIRFFDISTSFVDDADVVLLASADGIPLDVYLPAVPTNLPLLDSKCSVGLTPVVASPLVTNLEVQCEKLTLYVWLSTTAEGYFSDNAFHLRPGITRTVQFHSLALNDSVNLTGFTESFRILHLGTKLPRIPTVLYTAVNDTAIS